VFANVGLNRRLAALPEVAELHVHPAMTDSGIAVGAAVAVFAQVHGSRPVPLGHVALGPAHDDAVACAAFRAEGYDVLAAIDAEATLARALAAERVVARFVGGTEYGPRALGQRSVLAPAHRPDLAEQLNVRLDRAQVMPFAPMVLASDAPMLFDGLGSVRWPTRFMTTAVTCRAAMRATAPAAVHRDGTARPQIVSDDPGLTSLLSAYQAATGRLAVINTSFNHHDESIVSAPQDAARTARRIGLDVVEVGAVVCLRGPHLDYTTG
jgi:carbamoyltransferase